MPRRVGASGLGFVVWALGLRVPLWRTKPEEVPGNMCMVIWDPLCNGNRNASFENVYRALFD